MTTITFDTLKFAERLIDSGMPEKQAKALAEAQAEINEANLEELVTKSDLKNELAPIHSDMRLIKWMLALIIITTVVPALKSLFS